MHILLYLYLHKKNFYLFNGIKFTPQKIYIRIKTKSFLVKGRFEYNEHIKKL